MDLSQLSDEELMQAARAPALNPMMDRLIRQESGGNPNAVSPRGASGIVQIMPDTARDPGYGVRPLQGWDGVSPKTAPVEEQIRFGNDYLNAMQRINGGNPQLAAAAYNAGPGAVQKFGGVPPYQETQNYVKNVAPQTTTEITPVNNVSTQIDYSSMSDDDLMKAAGIEAQPTKSTEMGNNKGSAQSFVQGVNSAVPFGNRITAGLAAATLAPFTDLTTSELYRQARDDQRVTEEANPRANTYGAITGIAATLPVGFSKAVATTPVIGKTANALTNSSQAAGNFIRGGSSTLGKAGRSAIVAAPAGAVYGYGNSQNDLDTAAAGSDALAGAGLAAATGFALPVAGAAIKEAGKESANAVRGAFARNGEKLDEAGSALFKESKAAYDKMRQIGATINQPGVRDIGKKIDDALLNDGPLNQGLHGNTLSIVQQLKDEMTQPNFSLEKLDQFRRLLGRIPRSTPEDVRKSQIVISALDDAVDNIGISSISKGGKDAVDALTQARAAYTKASKFDRVKDLVDASGGDANKLKRSLERALQNDKFTRGFNGDEKAALEYAARNTTTEGLLKLGGKFGIDLGSSLSVGNAGLPALFGAVSTATSGAGTAGLGIAAGTVARQGQKYVARGKADQLLKVIERGGKVSPKQMQSINPSILRQAVQNNSITLPQLQQAFQAKKAKVKP